MRHLRYFVAVAEELHFTRAARRLGMAQPPLSQQIQQLEAELATPLFERGTRRVALTEAGRMLLPEARATLEQAARAVLVARRAGRGEIGELRIGLFASAPLLPVFTEAVLGFRRRLPDVHLALQESPTLEQVDALRRGALDAGFLRCPSAADIPGDVAAVELLRERLVAMMREDHPLARDQGPLPIAALAEQKLIFFARSVGTTLHAQFEALCRAAGFTPDITQTARENSTLIGLVAAGFGIAVMPASLAQIRVAEVTHRELAEPGATTSIWLATPRGRTSALARVLLDCAGA
ncbi:LysR substrate-binding domain-containing protein [Falsiroseomonas tokyonensis]|uniref:LysR substrate-binding domain-containing protein n=2 Tax=Falsiroseomonas tokyonensis TaxID=430521 RepID=A0ABV7BV48_9PROT|nr:LysR family transcriptional regulator [Falsiroseomonas tokyonensis]